MSDATNSAPTKTCPRCAEDIKEAAQVCHFCGYEFVPTANAQASTAPSATRTPLPAATPGPPPAETPKKRGRPGLVAGLVIIVLALAAGIGGALAWRNLSHKEAGSVQPYQQKFASAGFACSKFEADPALSSSLKVAFCTTTDSTGALLLFEVRSYESRPTEVAWTRERCAATQVVKGQAVVWGNGNWTVAVSAVDQATADAAAQKLAATLGGTARPLVCPAS